jgi:hypothetical protein
MKVAPVLFIAPLAAAVAWGSVSASALAQAPGADGYIQLVPGVYTTPEISAKCQAYAGQRVVGGSNTDTSRRAVALACAKKLWIQMYGKNGKKKSAG